MTTKQIEKQFPDLQHVQSFLIMFLFHVVLCYASGSKFSALVKKAKENAHKRRSLELTEEDVFPGDYKGSTYSYHVSKRLTGPASRNIAGFACSDTHIAIFPSNVRSIKNIEETESVFVNGESEKMYSLEYIETDEDVRIFEAKEVNPFLIVTNLKFSTHPLWGVSKSLEKKVNLNWNEGFDPFTDGMPNKKLELFNKTVNFSAGFYGKAVLDVEAEVKGIKSFSLSAKLNLKCIFGAGLDVNDPTFQIDLFNLFSKDFEIPNKLCVNILNYKFGILTKIQLRLDVEDIKLQLKLKFNLYKAYYFEHEKEIGISSELGFINPPQKHVFKDITSDVDMKSIVEKIKNMEISLYFTPKITLSLCISFIVGKTEYSPTYFDIIVGVPSVIQWVPSKCPSPPLHFNLSVTTDLQFRYGGFEICGITLIKEYKKAWRILKTKPKFSCLFNPKEVSESTEEGSFETDKDSYVIKSQYGHMNYIDKNPGIALSMYLKSDKQSLKGVYLESQDEPFEKGVLFDTNRDIIALDVVDPSSYQIYIEGFEKNSGLSRSYYTSTIPFDNITSEGSMYEIEESTYRMNSYRRILGLKLFSYKSVRIDVGKEFTVNGEIKYVCFNDDKYQQTYKMIYKKTSEEYVVALSNEFFSECTTGDADTYTGKYTNGEMAIITPIQSSITSNQTKTDEINIIISYSNSGIAAGRFKIPKHKGTKTAEQLGIQNQTCNIALNSGTILNVKVVDNEEEQYEKEFKCNLVGDILNVSFKYTLNYHTVLFKVEYSYPTIFSEIPEKTRSLMIVKDYYESCNCSDQYITISQKNFNAIKTDRTLYVVLLIKGYMPIVESVHIKNDLYMIKFNYSNVDTVNSNTYTIPCRRIDDATRLEFSFKKIMAVNSDGTFWYDMSKTFSSKNTAWHGCLIEGVTDKVAAICDNSDTSTKFEIYHISSDISNPDAYDYTIPLFYAEDPATGHFVMNEVAFDESEISRSIDLRDLAFDNFNLNISVTPFQKGIKQIYVTKQEKDSDEATTFIIDENSDGKFIVNVKTRCLITVTPICASETQSYCLFKLPATGNNYKLFKYNSTDAIESISGNVHFGKGVHNGIVKIDSNEEYAWKSWEGSIENSVVSVSINVNFKIFDNRTEISFETNNNSIAYSAYNIGLDIFKAMSVFGINAKEYKQDICEFTEDGRIIVYSNYDAEIRKHLSSRNALDSVNSELEEGLKWIVGIDPSYQINMNANFEEKYEHNKESTTENNNSKKTNFFTSMTFIGIACAAVVVVIAIVVIIVVLTKKNKVQQDETSALSAEIL